MQLPREIVVEKPGEFREAFPPRIGRKVILSQALVPAGQGRCRD
jgi:hypothetical protein